MEEQRNTTMDQLNDNSETPDEKELEHDIFLLKTTVVDEQSMPYIKMKLIATAKYRSDMLAKMELDLLETFPYFFSNPELVCMNLIKFQRSIE